MRKSRRFGACSAISALGVAMTLASPLRAQLLTDVLVENIPRAALPPPLAKSGGVPVGQSDCIAQRISFRTGSSWTLCVKAVTRYGLVISQVSFRRSPTSPAIAILNDARLGEIFVPYHKGLPRLADLAYANLPLIPLSAGEPSRSDCPWPRARLDRNFICREARDAGIAAKNDYYVRRGREVVYFSVLDADNYNYIAEWTFRDDGVILARAGATGTKLGGPDDTNGHMHNFTWRLDIDLDGPGGDSACIKRHIENLSVAPSTARDRCDPVLFETGLQWDPREFNSIVVSDSLLKNGRGRPTQYELIPLRTGASRHTELFSRNDFWITRADSSQLLAFTLPQYANGESTAGQDNVIWYTGSVDHEDHMRDEDRDVVPVIWVGFELRPRNVFDGTPLVKIR